MTAQTQQDEVTSGMPGTRKKGEVEQERNRSEHWSRRWGKKLDIRTKGEEEMKGGRGKGGGERRLRD